MKEQCIENYMVRSYTSHANMWSSMEDHIKRGWLVKTIHKGYDNNTIVVYEREVVDKPNLINDF